MCKYRGLEVQKFLSEPTSDEYAAADRAWNLWNVRVSDTSWQLVDDVGVGVNPTQRTEL